MNPSEVEPNELVALLLTPTMVNAVPPTLIAPGVDMFVPAASELIPLKSLPESRLRRTPTLPADSPGVLSNPVPLRMKAAFAEIEAEINAADINSFFI